MSLTGQNQWRWSQGQQGQAAWSQEGSPAKLLMGRQKTLPRTGLQDHMLHTTPILFLGLDGKYHGVRQGFNIFSVQMFENHYFSENLYSNEILCEHLSKP